MAGVQDWLHDTARCKRAGGLMIAVPEDGSEVQAFVLDVMARKVWFNRAGVYVIRNFEKVVQFVGHTDVPLGVRLRTSRSNRAPWTNDNYESWTVGLRLGDREAAEALAVKLTPVYHRRGVRAPGRLQASERALLSAAAELLTRTGSPLGEAIRAHLSLEGTKPVKEG
jgi:hypothetical protein